MSCEYCGVPHLGHYGSGRFCSSHCAHGFTTKAKRAEINLIVSSKLKGKLSGKPFVKGHDPRRGNGVTTGITPEVRRAAVREWQRVALEKWKLKKVNIENNDLVSKDSLKRYLLEISPQCSSCGVSKWMGKNIVLELHHKDGNPREHRLKNSELLCPNCHSLTDNYKFKGGRRVRGDVAKRKRDAA